MQVWYVLIFLLVLAQPTVYAQNSETSLALVLHHGPYSSSCGAPLSFITDIH